MPRTIGADGRTVYRAVITITGPAGARWTQYEGPYAMAGHARGRVAFWRTYMRRAGGDATGRVEQGHTVWAPVGDETDPLSAARAQAYRDAADEITALPQDYECDPGRGDAANFLRRRADEIHPATEEPNR